MRLADIIVAASLVHNKKGNVEYTKWREKKRRLLEEMEEDKNKTVFDRLKGKKRFSNTVFDRMQATKGKRYGV